jgi:hypothetical protein
VTTPSGVTEAIWEMPVSENQTLPSGPSMMPFGPAFGVGRSNSLRSPSIDSRPILWPAYSVNQRLPSAPVMIPTG